MPYPAVPPNVGLDFTPTAHHDTYPAIHPAGVASLAGKSVLVTGASKGIGRRIALSYALAGASKIAVGARSALDDLTVDILAAASSAGRPAPQVLPLILDVQDRQSVTNAAEDVAKSFGGLDILVNNAGFLARFAPWTEGDEDDWWTTWEVNVRGVYWVTKSVLPLMLKGGDKTIINLSSIGALNLAPGASAYQPSKLAVMRLAEYLMADYADQGLLSYSIHPGGVPTNMGNRLPARFAANLADTPELAGDTVVWLTSERRDWLAGRYISVTWDMPELAAKEKEIVERDLLKMRMAF